MSEYVWCHGPECHEYSTQDRIRGVGNNKVLRTRKIKTYPEYSNSTDMYSYFCSNRCYNDFSNKYIIQVIAIAPRHEPLETLIVVKKEAKQGWNKTYVDTTITKLDNRLE